MKNTMIQTEINESSQLLGIEKPILQNKESVNIIIGQAPGAQGEGKPSKPASSASYKTITYPDDI